MSVIKCPDSKLVFQVRKQKTEIKQHPSIKLNLGYSIKWFKNVANSGKFRDLKLYLGQMNYVVFIYISQMHPLSTKMKVRNFLFLFNIKQYKCMGTVLMCFI